MNGFYVCKRLATIVSVFLAVLILIGCSGASSWSHISDGRLDLPSIVTQIIQDSDRNLWFIVLDGRIYSYNPFTDEAAIKFWPGDNSLGLAQTLILEESGDMWIGSNQGLGYYRADLDQWKIFTTEDGLTSNDIRALLLDDNGSLWVGTGDEGLVFSSDNGNSWQAITIEEGFSDFPVYEIYQDRRNHIWVAAGSGLYRYEPEDDRWSTFTDGSPRYDSIRQIWSNPPSAVAVLPGVLVSSIYEDRDGRLWFGTLHGLSLYEADRNSWTDVAITNSLVNENIWAIEGDSMGRIWIGTEDGAARYDPVTQEWTPFDKQNGFTNFAVRDILLDSGGDLWFGTWGDGIFRYTVP